MKSQIRGWTAAFGAFALVGMGLLGLTREMQSVQPETHVAPATQSYSDEVTTTTNSSSFRPSVSATPPPPPTD